MTVTFGMTVPPSSEGGGAVNSNGRRVLAAKIDSLSNVNNNNNNNNGPAPNTPNAGKIVSVSRVRRVLFGPPADPAETRAWLDQQLDAATEANSKSWNFDFVNERPLRDSPADRYSWERVCPPPPPQQQKQQPQPRRDGDEASAADSAQKQDDCRRSATGKQRQTKVTDYMGQTKKRPLSIARSLRSNKMVDEELAASGNKRSRRSAVMMAI